MENNFVAGPIRPAVRRVEIVDTPHSDAAAIRNLLTHAGIGVTRSRARTPGGLLARCS